jgi:hypothetical protein
MGGQRADRSAEWFFFFSVMKPFCSRVTGKFGQAKRLAVIDNNIIRAIQGHLPKISAGAHPTTIRSF